MLDILIKNVNIIDGTKAPAYIGNVGVKDEKIVLGENLNIDEESSLIIDGTGLCITPGFIDAHSHGDGVYGTDYGSECKINQGITTEITGQCGSAMFPVIEEHESEFKKLLTLICAEFPENYKTFTSLEKYGEYVDNCGLRLNAKQLIGHGSLRISVMGYQNRKCTADELNLMKAAVREAMQHGALGISSGLIYSPSCFADTEELIELCKIVAEYGGIYATHMRNESKYVIESVKEALYIGKEAGVPVFISHHKVQGRPYWGYIKETLRLVHEAIENGQKVTIDQYPYLASMTSMNAIIPPWYFGDNLDGLTEKLKDPLIREKIKTDILDPTSNFENQYINCGGFENIIISSMAATPEYNGMSIADAAAKAGKDQFEMVFDMLVANGCVGSCIYFSMCDEDLCTIFKDENTVVGTDGIYTFRGQKTHPRSWNAFPHAICHFQKEKQLVSIEEMIYKITLLPATRVMIDNKGAIKDGWDADLVIMDYEKLQDLSDYKNAEQPAEGIHYVIVNGQVVYHDKKMTENHPGKLIRHMGRK